MVRELEDMTGRGISRRGFLRATAGGSVAIVAVSLLPTACAEDYTEAADDEERPGALSAKEFAVAVAAAEALLVGVPVEPRAVALGIDRDLAAVGDPIREDMKTVFSLLEHLTLLGGHATRFTRLEPAERLQYLRGWGRSRFNLRRAAFQATRGFVYFHAYSREETRPLTGFEGPWRERIEIPAYPVDYGEVV